MRCRIRSGHSGTTRIGAVRDRVSRDKGEHGRQTCGTLCNEVPYAIGVTRGDLGATRIGTARDGVSRDQSEHGHRTCGTLSNEVPYAIGMT
ncbi:hypothetical protein TIFTF001_016899 [Ficus carica]|uniref:Uncharacterized protein n=1 Tax=Ficus carica TaxID=3494 RepID=A0AA88AKB0_FICCA|nr:hypothetical protein TIFTF001_016899 [Ficus carica]